jgi:transposase
MGNNIAIDNLILENTVLKAELAEVKQQLSWVTEQLISFRRKLYGSSSEKSVYDDVHVQTEIFEDVQAPTILLSNDDASDAKAEESTSKPSRPKKRGEMSSRLPEGLPVEIVECTLPEDEQICPIHAIKMHSIGKEVVRRELKIIPAKVIIREIVQTAYSCRDCEKSTEPPLIIKAPLPPQVIKGSMCTPETVAHIIVEKCVMGSPIHRQEKAWRRLGIPLTRQTMNNWGIRCSQDYFEPIYDELHRLLLLQDIAQSDGTVLQVLREPGKPAQSDSQMWLYRSSCGANIPIVLYDYQPDKKQERPRDFLAGFSGYLLTDGAQSYHCLPDRIIVVGCFAHALVKFSDALKCLNKEDRAGSLALIGKSYCKRIFDIDREIEGGTFEERYKIRLEKAVPILDEFNAWLKSVEQYVSKKSKLGKAVGYTLNQWKYLTNYLLDGRIECSNNKSERTIKTFVINRKNFLFATSVAGARATAITHSLTETAIENGLDPFKYLTYVLHMAAGRNIREDDDLLNKLMPHNAPDSCKALFNPNVPKN